MPAATSTSPVPSTAGPRRNSPATRATCLVGERGRRRIPTYDNGYVAIALDAAGDVVATGNGQYGPLLYHYVWTLKLGGADGTLRWLQRYLSAPFGTEDYANAVAVDGAGDVVVVGYGYEGAPVAHAQKYAGTNGALLWAGAGSSWSYAAVAIDPWGNPLVAGSGGVTKLVGSDGLTVWNANSSATARDCACCRVARSRRVPPRMSARCRDWRSRASTIRTRRTPAWGSARRRNRASTRVRSLCGARWCRCRIRER